jgi:AraC-like DNA-binding protein
VRAWLAQEPAAGGVLQALYDPAIGKALATQRLQWERVSIAALADELGYDSEGAFSRAFRHFVGLAPGESRRKPDLDKRRAGQNRP